MSQPSGPAFELSPQQRRIWTLQKDVPRYTTRARIRISGPVDPARLRTAVLQVIGRHEILRTVFEQRATQQEGAQVVLPVEAGEWLATSHDRSALPGGQSEPAPRFQLCRVNGAEHELQVVLPSLCADESTVELLLGEIATCYAGRTLSPAVQFADAAAWLNSIVDESGDEEALAAREFWCSWKVAGAPAVPPGRCSLTEDGGPATGTVRWTISAEEVREWEGCSQRLGVALSDFLLAAWAALLSIYSGDGPFTIGVRVDGRLADELTGALGPYDWFLPVTFDPEATPRFSRWSMELSDRLGFASGSLDRFCWSQLSGSNAGLAVGFQFRRHAPSVIAGPVSFVLEEVHAEVEPCRLNLSAREDGGTLTLNLHFDRSTHDNPDADRLLDQLCRLIRQVIDRPDLPLAELDVTCSAERSRAFAGDGAPVSPGEPVHVRFGRLAARNPDALAVVAGDDRRSYREVSELAQRLTSRLVRGGVEVEELVGLHVERSAALVTGILGILTAGAAYVPLDPQLPPERLAFLIREAGIRRVVTQPEIAGALPEVERTLYVEDDSASPFAEPPPVSSRQLAYGMFTSGSTGTPKLVLVEHGQIEHYATAIAGRLGLQPGHSFAMVTTYAADLGLTAFWGALTTGGCLHVVAPDCATDAEQFAAYNRRHHIDYLKIVPSHLSALLMTRVPVDVLPRTWLVLGGEALQASLVQQVRQLAPNMRVLNHYGPTEATVGALAGEAIENPWGSAVPIGRPLGEMRAYLLSKAGVPVPAGAPGELYLSGPGVARGYQNNEEMTAERFPRLAIDNEHPQRMYRTGDICRLLPNGDFEFLGRRDDQVKLLGYRVELEEVRAALLGAAGVRDAAVVVRGNGPTAALVGYVVSTHGAKSGAAVHEELHRKLPEPMVPAQLIFLDRLPITGNGKLDRAALQATEDARHEPFPFPPADPLEQWLAILWGELLGVSGVGPRDDFFALGGHSLMAMRLAGRVRGELDVDLPLRTLFVHPTIAGVAEYLRTSAPDPRRILDTAEVLLQLSQMSEDEIEQRLQGYGLSGTADVACP